MTASLERVFQTVQQLSPAEQLELIQAISPLLLRQYQQMEANSIPTHVKRAVPVTDLAQLAADF